jgi:hypothetical protein
MSYKLSEYTFAFTLQLWLRERITMLHYMYAAYPVQFGDTTENELYSKALV